jgi:glucose 1-dehydrogenase
VSDLRGKTAVITGAASGIGRATVERFQRDGAVVIAVDREPKTVSLSTKVARWVQADIRDPDAAAAAAAAARELGGMDICVANAGISRLEGFLDGSPDSWQPILNVNLLGVMLTLRAAAHEMVGQARGGRLLATASVAGIRGEPFSAAYAASKGGVMALIRTLAVELASHRITVNAVAPGQIDTALNRADLRALAERRRQDPEEYQADYLASNVPVGRLGTPAEVAALFAFLASDDAAFITGATLRLDGGELPV